MAQTLPFDAELKAGVAAFENGEFKEAVERFQLATRLDPTSVSAHLYLARTYNELYRNPDVDEQGWRVMAMGEFQRVLALDRANTEALNTIAYLHRSKVGEWDQAEDYYRRAIGVDPINFEALYSVADIDWMQSYKTRMETRLRLKMSKKQKLVAHSECKAVRRQNLDRVNEGIALMSRALDVLKAPDAMSYMYLLYTERADIQCGDQKAYAEDRTTALSWLKRACEARNATEQVRIPVRLQPVPPPPPGMECYK